MTLEEIINNRTALSEFGFDDEFVFETHCCYDLYLSDITLRLAFNYKTGLKNWVIIPYGNRMFPYDRSYNSRSIPFEEVIQMVSFSLRDKMLFNLNLFR